MPPRPRCPRIFGDYALLSPLAEARADGVYLATSSALAVEGRACVVKIRRLPAGRPVPAAPSISHPNLVRVIDAGHLRDQVFRALEWRTGRDLLEIWNRCAQMRAPLPLAVGCRIVADALAGLSALHDDGRAHLQVCPAKMLVALDGTTALGEGSLRIAVHGPGPGFAVGRAGYLAPEQLGAGGGWPSADVYAAGVILWELLKTRTGFGAPVLRALERDPANRFSHAREFLDDLTRAGVPLATAPEVARFVKDLFGQELAEEGRRVRALVDQGAVLLGGRPSIIDPTAPPPVRRQAEAPAVPRPEFPLGDLDEQSESQPLPRKPPLRTPAHPTSPLPGEPPRVSGSAGYVVSRATSPSQSRAVPIAAAALIVLLAGGGISVWLGSRAAETGAVEPVRPIADQPAPPPLDEPASAASEPTLPARNNEAIPASPSQAPAVAPAIRAASPSATDRGRQGARRVSRVEPGRGDALLKEAQDAYDRSNFMLAIRKASSAVAAGERSEANVVMGDAYLALRDWSRAAAAYRKALKSDRRSESARLGLRKALTSIRESQAGPAAAE